LRRASPYTRPRRTTGAARPACARSPASPTALQAGTKRDITLAVVYAPVTSGLGAVATRQELYTLLGGEKPDVVLGDFNVDPASENTCSDKSTAMALHGAWLAAARYRDVLRTLRYTAWTWASRSHNTALPANGSSQKIIRRRLDHIYVRRHAHYSEPLVVQPPIATDHRMLCATVTFFAFVNQRRKPVDGARKTDPPPVPDGGSHLHSAATAADRLASRLGEAYTAFLASAPALTALPPRPPTAASALAHSEDTREAILTRDALRASARRLTTLRSSVEQNHLQDARDAYRAARRTAKKLLRRDSRKAWTTWLRELARTADVAAHQALRPYLGRKQPQLSEELKQLAHGHFRNLLSAAPKLSAPQAETLARISALPPIHTSPPAAWQGPPVPANLATDGAFDVLARGRGGCGVVGEIGNDPVSLHFVVPEVWAQRPSTAELAAAMAAVETAADRSRAGKFPVALTLVTDCRYVELCWWSTHQASAWFPGEDAHLVHRLQRAKQVLEDGGGSATLQRLARCATRPMHQAHDLARGAIRACKQVPLGNELPFGPLEYRGMQDAPPCREELYEVLRTLKGRRGVGPDKFQGLHFKTAVKVLDARARNHPKATRQAAHALLDALHTLVLEVWTTHEIPRGWRRAEIIPLPKVANATKCDELRGIALTSHVAKVASAILARRVARAPLGTWQTGFRPKRGTNMRSPRCNNCWAHTSRTHARSTASSSTAQKLSIRCRGPCS
jgi:hypothetical protein